MRVVVINHLTVDGVMQSPGRPDEETRGGFSDGGWAIPANDDAMIQAIGERMATHASVSEDGRAVTLSGIHSPPWWSSESSWWSFDRAEIDETEMAVSILLWMRQRRQEEVGARQVTGPDQRITVALPAPLAGRVVIDGNARLVEATGERKRSSEPQPWDRVVRADDRTLVVYWVGWNARTTRLRSSRETSSLS